MKTDDLPIEDYILECYELCFQAQIFFARFTDVRVSSDKCGLAKTLRVMPSSMNAFYWLACVLKIDMRTKLIFLKESKPEYKFNKILEITIFTGRESGPTPLSGVRRNLR